MGVASDIAADVRAGRRSAVAVVEENLARIGEREPTCTRSTSCWPTTRSPQPTTIDRHAWPRATTRARSPACPSR